jgi:sugar phosphate isomerase/epimerase
MRLGLFTVLFPDFDLEELMTVMENLGLDGIELSSKAGRGLRHFDPLEIVSSDLARIRFQDALKRKNITISQLNCSCNPVSPIPGEAKKSRADFELAFRLAEKLGVHTIGSFSGCPAGGPGDLTPNWITCPWPPEFTEMLKWQWEEKLIPFWTWAANEGAGFGVDQLAIEMHPGFCVYNPETLLKLRQAVGSAIGANLDPSHLIWQGIDVAEAIRSLKGAIWHVHVKDTYIDQTNVRKNGNIDTKQYSHIEERAWTFRTVGYGMSQDKWKQIIFALRLAGYDGILSIEHEDILMSKIEGLAKAVAFLKPIMPEQSPDPMWWA